ncbi:MAG: histidine kinase famiy protein [Xylophilus ampelinus]
MEKKENLQPKVNVSAADSGANAIAEHRNDIFFAAIQTTRMPMLVTDPHQPDNPIVFANHAFLTMTGYEPEELVGRNCRFLQGPMTDRVSVAAIREAIEARRDIALELLNYRKDGSSFWNALFISPVFNERQELVYFFASQLDVSRRKDAEEALAQARKMEALGQLTGGIAHDFNNLLQVISGHLEMLGVRLSHPSIDVAGAQRTLGKSRDAVTRGAHLTQQMLAFARKQRLVGRPINLNNTAQGLQGLIDTVFKDGVAVNLALAPDLPNCQVDPTQLEMALLNLIRNANDAMDGPGTLTIKTGVSSIGAEDRRSFGDLPAGQYVSLSITDSGHGIPSDVLGRVLDPFFTTKEEGKGTGLGLSMVYGFAKQSGGAVEIYSEVEVGTTVRLYFPVTANALVKADAQQQVVQRGGSEHILVVDDRAEVAHLARDMLEGLGYAVSTAYSATEALELRDRDGQALRPRLLFTDLIMPGGMNGVNLAKEMLHRQPDLRVLLTTGYAGDPDAGGSDSPGSEFPLINKPYRLADLARKIRQVLDE